jgi:hypothetical protein
MLGHLVRSESAQRRGQRVSDGRERFLIGVFLPVRHYLTHRAIGGDDDHQP